jgi:hypothetical protein
MTIMDEAAAAPDLVAVIRHAGELLAGAHEGLGHLCCGEIQGVVDLLLAVGLRDTAIDVIMSHALGDDDANDVHHHVYLAVVGDGGAPHELAEAMIDAQLRGEPLLRWRNRLPNGDSVTYPTKNARDEHAPHLANAWKTAIRTELWEAPPSRGDVDQGWARDGVVEPARQNPVC